MLTPSARILVTGANGQIGRRWIDRRLEPGSARSSLRALVRSPAAAQILVQQFSEALAQSGSEVLVGRYDDPASLREACRNCSAVVHLVGIIKESPRSRYINAHEGSCQQLADAAAANGVQRIVYLSLLGSDPSSSNACLASRGRAEAILRSCPVATTILRVPMVLGGNDPASAALRKQSRSRWLPLVGGGRTWQQPIAGDDVVRAIDAALMPAESGDVQLDLVGPEALHHRELIQRCAALAGRPAPRFIPVPTALANAAVALAQRLSPDPPVTRAMLGVLQHDDRGNPDTAASQLGITLTPLDRCLEMVLQEEDS